MRWVFYSLLIFNLVYAVWHVSLRVMAPAVTEVSAQVQQVTTLDAPLDLEVISARELPLRKPLEPGAESRCIALGPWETTEEAVRAKAALGEAAAGARLKALRVQQQSLTWVYLPPFASRDEALVQLHKLHQLDIDSFITDADGVPNAISLGYFEVHSSALGLQQRIRQAGFDARAREIEDKSVEYWLLMAVATEKNGISDYLQQHDKLSMKRVSCG